MSSKLILAILSLSLILSCKSSSKLVEQGNYDKAIDRAIKKILKGSAKAEDKEMLDKAYNLANSNDRDKITILKKEGEPKSWERIYKLYSSLDKRQRIVKKALPFEYNGRTINYPQVDYSSSIVEAKTKAADFFYHHGLALMETNIKSDYRQAYYQFIKARDYKASAFPNINEQIQKAHALGTSYVLVEIKNASNQRLPSDFFDQLLPINKSNFESTWVNYTIKRRDRETMYDYQINIILDNILISPEQVNKSEVVRTKEIQDGFEYVLDAKGNVQKDSIGNDIKTIKYTNIQCNLVKIHQLKKVTTEASIEYRDLNNQNTLYRESFAATSIFEHQSAKARGNTEALYTEDVRLLDNSPAPFPDDLSMIYDCINPLKTSIESILKAKKSLIK